MKPAIFILLFCLFNYASSCQVVINEFAAINGNGIIDQDSSHSEWVELYNPGNSTLNLQGYALADHPTKDDADDRWIFPERLLAPGGFLVIFLSGKNRTGLELHTSFGLSADEHLFLFDVQGKLVDAIESDAPQLDHSFGRKSDGANQFVYFPFPTAGFTNDLNTSFSGYSKNPGFSQKAGFYPDTLSLDLIAENGARVFFSTDGSLPGASSSPLNGNIIIDRSCTVKAISYQDGKLPSEVVSNTYFINYTSTLPVFSLSCKPELLWHPLTGIYVNGPGWDSIYPHYGANYWQDLEIPVHAEVFQPTGEKILNQDLGLKIHGGTVSRNKPQKSLRLLAKKEYGKSRMDFPFITDKPHIKSYKRLVLRNASSDFNRAQMRDALAQRIILRSMDVDVIGYEPAVVFINGEYFGLMDIREKTGPYYLEENHGADPGNIDAMKEDSIVEDGDYLDFFNLHQFIVNNDPANEAVFDSVSKRLDTESFADYFIAETFMNNSDWPLNNIKYWREKKQGARWRYVLFDLDISFVGENWAPVDENWIAVCLGPMVPLTRHMQIAESLLQNGSYRNYFINRYADLLNTAFTPDSILSVINETRDKIAPEIPAHKIRWGGYVQDWEDEISSLIIPFAEQRQQIVRNQVQQQFGLAGQTPVELSVWPPESGTIKINSITPHKYPFIGIYYQGVSITCTAIAAAGTIFREWKSDNPVINGKTEQSFTIDPQKGYSYTAVYWPYSGGLQLNSFPNPCNQIAYAGFYLPDNADAILSIHDVSGRQLFELKKDRFQKGMNTIDIPTATLPQGIYNIVLHAGGKKETQRLVVIH